MISTTSGDSCAYFIKRKRRLCSHRRAEGRSDADEAFSSLYCTLHQFTALEESRRVDEISRLKHDMREIILEIADSIENEKDEREGIWSTKRRRKKRISAKGRMANPYSKNLSPDVSFPHWSEIFTDEKRPLHIDIGCAKGRCIERLSMRSERLDWNHFGIEIRSEVLKETQDRVLEGLAKPCSNRNLHFMAFNFAASFEKLFDCLPANVVRLLSFQFPDPWSTSKRMRRRIVQAELVSALASRLPPGACVYISSDNFPLALHMKRTFLSEAAFAVLRFDSQTASLEAWERKGFFVLDRRKARLSGCGERADVGIICTPSHGIEATDFAGEGEIDDEDDESDEDEGERGESDLLAESEEADEKLSDDWIDFNPLGEPSERELYCEKNWRKVYRCVLERL